MKLRLEPQDEYMHPLEEAKNFNESMYFNVYDSQSKVGGFFRLGNRANEGYAEMTTCLYLPDGRVAFMYQRPSIKDNDSFNAGGMKFEVVEPFKALKVSYKGKVVTLDNPLDMAEPRKAFKENPWTDCEVTLDYSGLSPMYGGEPESEAGERLVEPNPDEGGFARGHYEQHVAAKGTIKVGDQSWEISGHGLRDHSWGPRFWQSPWWYRWLTINFGDDFGGMVTIVTSRDGSQRIGGMIFQEGRYDLIKEATIETTWTGGDMYHEAMVARVKTEKGEDFEITGKVLNLIPLRNRRKDEKGEDLMTRISEGLTEFRCRDKVGYGWSEYLDQIVDNRPVGAAS
ncbi:MAG: hypothetical protein KDH09_10170 [Chrysiogenetes bacterium]|nr:hypothetical protein [Chrysiogenetes bacterium]